MSAPQKFRSAFNGFNREDVVSYLEYLNSRHTAQVNQLTAEADQLRVRLENAQPEGDQADVIAALEQERDELREQLAELQARYDALQQNQGSSAPFTPCEELEIYRRAERTERMARERADIIYRQANGILTEVTVRVNDMAGQVIPAADQILAQLSALQNTVSTTKQSLQDAAVILGTLRSDNT